MLATTVAQIKALSPERKLLVLDAKTTCAEAMHQLSVQVSAALLFRSSVEKV
jgi:hypothetical protein